jgi:hypothetical protein
MNLIPKLSDPDHYWFFENEENYRQEELYPPDDFDWTYNILDNWTQGTVEEYASTVAIQNNILFDQVIQLIVETFKEQIDEDFGVYEKHYDSLIESGYLPEEYQNYQYIWDGYPKA